MILKWFLNLIGIVIFFLNKFTGRTDKNKEISIKFWVKDNWPELLTIVLFDLALMILLVAGGLELDFEKLFPTASEGVTIVGDLAACFFIGLVLAWAFYNLFKKKIKR